MDIRSVASLLILPCGLLVAILLPGITASLESRIESNIEDLFCVCPDGYVPMCKLTHSDACVHWGVFAGAAVGGLLFIAFITCCCCCCCGCCRRQPRNTTVVVASPPSHVLTVTTGGHPYARMQEEPYYPGSKSINIT